MFTLSRLMLVGSVLIAGAFLGVGFIAFLPMSLYAALGLGAYRLWKGRWGPLSACGTARWASEGDVRGLDSGLGVGRLEIPPRTPEQKLAGRR